VVRFDDPDARAALTFNVYHSSYEETAKPTNHADAGADAGPDGWTRLHLPGTTLQ
jgi:hypothetical protein